MWHSARIEDMTISVLVNNSNQLIDEYIDSIGSTIYSTGNELTSEQIMDWSQSINMESLNRYRQAVTRQTLETVNKLTYKDLKRKTQNLDSLIESGSVSTDENAVWLINFWRKKNVMGILYMPCLRHNLVHINESLEAKKVIRSNI